MNRTSLRFRRQIQLLNAQSWADFKLHWPMEVFRFVMDICGGFIFGFALSMALFVYVLDCLSRVAA